MRRGSSRAIGWEPTPARITPTPSKPQGRASAPSIGVSQHPWRYRIGQYVHVWGFSQDLSFRIIGGELLGEYRWPHYHLEAPDGDKWTVPQMHLSSKSLERAR